MEEDSLAFAEILEELATSKSEDIKKCSKNTLAARVISFKKQISLNCVSAHAGGLSAIVQGLEEVLGEVSICNDNYLLFVSREVADTSDDIDLSSSDHMNESEQLSELQISKENNRQCTNKVDLSTDLLVKAGPNIGSSVQFITGKSPLQSASAVSSVQKVKTELLTALALKDARYMVSVFVQSVIKLRSKLVNGSNAKDVVLPLLLIKCRSEKPQNIAWLCCRMEHVAKDGFKKGIFRSFLVRDEYSVLDLEKNLQKLFGYKSEKCQYFARYDLLSSVFKQDYDDAMEHSKLILEFSWQDQTAPNQPPPSAADTLIKFQIVPSDPSSPLSAMYIELIQLENIIHGVSEASDEVWADMMLQKSTKKSIIEQLSDFLEALKTAKYVESDASDKKEGPSMDKSPLSSFILDNFCRKDHDFTDELWEFLRNAISFDEVLQSLDYIFAAICTREIQPVFNSENKTDLAQWVREFYRASNQSEGKEKLKERFSALLDNRIKVFELVANLGLEKFTRDYISFFVNEELATFGQLESVFRYGGGLKKRMLDVWKLHHILELVALSIVFLHLPIDYLRLILKTSLDYFKDVTDLSIAPVFSVSIPAVSPVASLVIDHCTKMKPVLWKCSSNLTSGINGKGLLKMFISCEDREASFDVDTTMQDDTEVFNLHKVVTVTESSVRVY